MTGLNSEEIRHLEDLTLLVWPPAKTDRLDGWVMAFDRGVTHRANAVFPNTWSGRCDLAEAISEVERRYRAQGLQPTFKLTSASMPTELDRVLAGAGYWEEGAADVMVAGADQVAAACGVANDVKMLCSPGPGWIMAAGWQPQSNPSHDARRQIVGRIAEPRAFAVVEVDGEPAGAAAGVVRGGWAYLCAVHTRPEFRGRGIGRALIGSLASWAAESGAARLFVPVEIDNPRAKALYERCALRTAYHYHYRVASAAP